MKEWEERKDCRGEMWSMKKKIPNRTVVKDGTICRVFGDNLRHYYIFSKMTWGVSPLEILPGVLVV